MKKNPLKQSEYIKSEFSKYVKSTFVLSNERYNRDFNNELDNSVLTKGPFLKLELPFKKSKSINQLINDKEVSPLFSTIGNINFDLTLYYHQHETLNRIKKGHSVVVTTGTGSGKTEAFFYPIINSLLTKIEKDGFINGIQVILLYPMNALVNDQLDRLRKHLNGVPSITFGYFTGDTPEEYIRKKGTGEYEKCTREKYIEASFSEDDVKPPSNELLTRQEIRETPPNILITNYSMLEYLLVRPKDSMILNDTTLHDWSFMVLDEAHTYRGTLATEVSHLLRRLQFFARKKPQFILTSATLGSTYDEKKGIIDFASKLTSSDYFEEDIIYATRVKPDIYVEKYQIETQDYKTINSLINEKKDISFLLDKYSSKDLFDLLSHDRNVHILYKKLLCTDTFENVYSSMCIETPSISKEEFISLISLVTYAKNSDGMNIYDIKYHFFVRTLEGAFISLEPQPKLEITNRQKIGDMWAFEIGVCRNCNSMYIVGKEYDNHLYRSELELDENYEFFDDLEAGFYLIKNDVINEVSDHLDDFEEYTVCSKCGQIYQNNDVTHLECSCGKEFRVELLKVIQNSSTIKNNLQTCPVCGKHKNKIGMVNSFKISKDQSTALLSQILLHSMDLFVDEKKKNDEIKINIFEGNIEVDEIQDYYKQFLAFSDSRQQASFYALFFQENQNKFLRKALVYRNCDKKSTLDSLVGKLEVMIHDKNLFKDNDNVHLSDSKNAYISILLDLFKSDGVNSLEGLGLLSFEPDFSHLFSLITEEQLNHYLPKVKYESLKDLLCIYTELFRTAPAISYIQSGLTYEERRDYLEYRSFDNSVMLEKPQKLGDDSVRSLIPVNSGSTNLLTQYMTKTFNLDDNEVLKYIEILWKMLSGSKVVEFRDNGMRGRIDFSKYIIIPQKESIWYRCNKCGTLTTHNINDCCVKGSCSGKLVECDPDEVLKDNYYREEYKNKKIESIIVQEHTGQLNREKGRIYQKEFKAKHINVLSSSTTFEMGVNIGTLDTVLMRNFPPTNANYAQRAGRAGRSDESVAFITTYANHISHDQIYFKDPVPMIEGKINPPYFKLDNIKISSRHIMAFIVSSFYRTKEMTTNLEYFLKEAYDLLITYINENKNKIEQELSNVLPESSYSHFKDFEWFSEMTKSDSLLNTFKGNVTEEIDNLKKAEAIAREQHNYHDADNYKRQRNNINKMDIVTALAKYNVIPGYGFPIDVVPLKVYDRVKKDFNKGLDLNRDLSIALSEYAPDSEIIVDKNKYTSRYIILPKDTSLPTYYYYKCTNPECGKIHINNIKEENYVCEVCSSPASEMSFIEPNLGFITDEKNKDSTILKPRKTYSSEISYLGSMEPYKADLNIKDTLLIQQTSDDKLLIVNENPFFYCPVCGYAVLDKKKKDLDEFPKVHEDFRGHACEHKNLSAVKLGHIVTTDVIKMRVKIPMNFDTAISTITAIINGITAYLQIDSNDINGILVRDIGGQYAFVFYDTTYGGAGNVKQLTNKEGLYNIMKTAYESVNQDCCDENTSCTCCLRNYKNSKYHKYLVRKIAKDTLKKILVLFKEG
jgi:ATP-dependent helicase YprA (DUF1998 family)